ncbi:MAG: hypothetical protein NTW28_19690 [Candidatus Solibacter sp.]|nr:hypothetical protein [Candidatus Solibacter sp.]
MAAKTRYDDIQTFTAAGDQSSFAGLRPRPIPETAGVVEHVIAAGERLDLIARHYYNDDRAWWRIVDANPWMVRATPADGSERFAQHLYLTRLEGRTILIPKAKS